MTFQRWELLARLLLGSFYLISGLNWIFGYISFLPHIGMPHDLPIRMDVVAEMVKTGWLYQAAKILEIVVGVSLIVNRFAPLTLAATAPVAFITCILGMSLIASDIWGWLTGSVPAAIVGAKILAGALGGLSIMLVHIWLMLCYFDYYRSALTSKALPREIN